jgi:hypothetical protein
MGWRQFLIVTVVGVLLAGNVIITHNQFTKLNPGMNDFLSRWEGARLFWQEGISPYDDAASLSIQEIIYGRPATADEDLGLFAYPFYTVLYVAPVVWLPYSWASAVWMVFLEVCLVAGLYLLLATIRWRPALMTQVALVSLTLLNYFAFRGLILGQLSHIVFMLTAFALYGLSRGHDGAAGIALALATIKPQMGFLLVPFMLLWALVAGRRRFFFGFVGCFALLMAASFAMVPNWFVAWVEQVRLYPTYTRDGSPVWILFEFLLEWPSYVGYVVRAVLVGVMLWAWYSVLVQRREERLLWTIALTLAVTHTAGPRTATPHYMVFWLVLLVYLANLLRRRRIVLAACVMAGVMMLPWMHFLTTIIDGNLENLAVFLPPVTVVWLLLIVTREDWWSLPRYLTPEQATS